MKRFGWLVLAFLLGLVTGIVGIPRGYPLATSLFPVLFALPCLFFVLYIYKGQGAVALVFLGLFAIIIETIGLITGFPYGHFSYDSMYAHRLFGVTPVIVPFGWVPIIVGVYFSTFFLNTTTRFHFFLFLLVLLATDAIVDPGAVGLSFWHYQQEGVYYGVPFSNFLGWMLSGSLGYVMLRYFFGVRKDSNLLYIFLLLLCYWTGVTLGLLYILPSIFGFGLFLLLYRKLP